MKLVLSEKETLGIVSIFRDFYDIERKFQENKSAAAAEQRNLQEKIALMLPQFAELFQAYLNLKSSGGAESASPSPGFHAAPATAPYFNFLNSVSKDLSVIDFTVEAVVGGKNPMIVVKEALSGMTFRIYPKAWPELPEMTICDERGAFVGTLQWSAFAPYIQEIPSLRLNIPDHIAFRNPNKIVINGDTCDVEFTSEPEQVVRGIPCSFHRDDFNTPHYVLDAMGTENWFLSGDLFSTLSGRAWLYERGGESCEVVLEVIQPARCEGDESDFEEV